MTKTSAQLSSQSVNELNYYYEAAKTKHPNMYSLSHRLLHITEELGEAVKEFNDFHSMQNYTETGWNEMKDRIKEELYHVAVTAIRTIEENINENDIL